MKKINTNGITRAFHRVGFKVKKHSPEILITAGVVGVVTSCVMACRATTKLNDILEESKKNVDTINAAAEVGVVNDVEYTKEDSKKDLAIVYTQTAVKVVKLYAPAVAVGALSLTGIIASNKILRNRYVAMSSAYAIANNSFKEYRGRVIERFGKELDRELKYNIKAEEVERKVVDEKGKEKIEKEVVKVGYLGKCTEHAKYFDETCLGWTRDAEMNMIFLKQQQSFANELLQARGHVFLNEVYDMLGIDRTKAGNMVGWVYDEEHPVGDNFIDFGIYDDINEPRRRAFVNGYEKSILLDFNIDGNILDLMP